MQGSEVMILYLALFIGVLLIFDGIMQVASRGKGEETVNRRLRMLASGADPEEVLRLLRRRRQVNGLERIPGAARMAAAGDPIGPRDRPEPPADDRGREHRRPVRAVPRRWASPA